MNKGYEDPSTGNSWQIVPRRGHAGVMVSLNNKTSSKNSCFVDLT